MASRRNHLYTSRVRAAWAYSGQSQADLAKKTKINERTLEGYLSKKAPHPTLEDALRIAWACGVPKAFIEEGFEATRSHNEQLADMQHMLRQIHASVVDQNYPSKPAWALETSDPPPATFMTAPGEGETERALLEAETEGRARQSEQNGNESAGKKRGPQRKAPQRKRRG